MTHGLNRRAALAEPASTAAARQQYLHGSKAVMTSSALGLGKTPETALCRLPQLLQFRFFHHCAHSRCVPVCIMRVYLYFAWGGCVARRHSLHVVLGAPGCRLRHANHTCR